MNTEMLPGRPEAAPSLDFLEALGGDVRIQMVLWFRPYSGHSGGGSVIR